MKKNIFLVLAIVGIILPYTQFVPWANNSGSDLESTISMMFANQISSGIAIDVILTAIVTVIFIVLDKKDLRVKYWWAPIIGVFVAGVSFALPFYLYLRERAKENIKA